MDAKVKPIDKFCVVLNDFKHLLLWDVPCPGKHTKKAQVVAYVWDSDDKDIPTEELRKMWSQKRAVFGERVI